MPPPRAACPRSASSRRRSSACCRTTQADAQRRRPHRPVDRIEPNPEQPRLAFNEETLEELAASIREHGVLQPILVRPLEDEPATSSIAGERRWRASKPAGLDTIPALIEEIDDDTALEISIIENLQREDISPLDEAAMYDRMVREHGYSIRKLADKLGKDKGYLENRLRLADAPDEVRELVSLRKDTLSHAYELMKVEDPKKRKRLADQVARGELTLDQAARQDRGPPRRGRRRPDIEADFVPEDDAGRRRDRRSRPRRRGPAPRRTCEPHRTTRWSTRKQQLAEAVEALLGVLRVAGRGQRRSGDVDRANLAKYLTIAKLRLENAIAMVRSTD